MTSHIAATGTVVKNKAIIWTISGADCSGGAGIAADIKTGHNLKVEVCHLITANTVQNSHQLLAINAVDVDILAAQAKALTLDKPPAVIKIGLIANQQQLTWLVAWLGNIKQQFSSVIVVYDPVLQASVGGRLSKLISTELQPLLPLIDVITPNLIEATQLSAMVNSPTTADVLTLANRILSLGVKAVIIKGGHQQQAANQVVDCSDTCLQSLTSSQRQVYTLRADKIATNASHGGGCSFATALASFLAHGYLLRDAFTLSKAFIHQGLALSHETECGTNDYRAFEQGPWPTQPSDFPSVFSPLIARHKKLPPFPCLGLKPSEKLGLYPVVDSLAWLKRLLPLNIKIIQLRIKDKQGQALANTIAQAIALARSYQCRLFINDHWQLAMKYGGYGVHLGQEDLANANLMAIARAGLRLGISSHGCYELLLAKQLQPSYLAIGAIFATKTKDMTGQIQGLANLKQLLALAESVPVVAIGGINTEQRLQQVWQTGVNSIALVSAITKAAQPLEVAKKWQAQLV
ncbi:thiamine-phosphate diphosphorylase [Colwellia chukchiensis]|uniref:Thiamine-phosphate diphosphorylase n=1 Tax=Colwellia chukchiensis TaxID=641665 RepID=A0A1H7HVL1_9GAMM|nr:thiamine phosphate synthase [Colwellia chukchiensis]SEK54311.1 thiamine-phosphate diphosphorylase [Colwellia chukchiensis]